MGSEGQWGRSRGVALCWRAARGRCGYGGLWGRSRPFLLWSGEGLMWVVEGGGQSRPLALCRAAGVGMGGEGRWGRSRALALCWGAARGWWRVVWVKVDPSRSVGERRRWVWVGGRWGVDFDPSRSVGERRGLGVGRSHALLESGGGGCWLWRVGVKVDPSRSVGERRV